MTEANKGLTVTRDGNTIKYGIDADRLVENINGATTKITNVNGDNIDLSKNSSITNITKSDGLLSKKEDKNADNIGYSERTAWAGKLGTGKITFGINKTNLTNTLNDTFVKKNVDNLDDNDKLAWKKALGILKNDGSNQLMNSWKIKAGTGSEETVTDGETVKFFAG